MDPDIQFGELEHARPETHLRPDRNKHYAVAEVYSPQESELPIFVDVDVMRDMEEHALSDTGVELGGVMLGGQYEDQDGRPFVVVTDSLRAKHYESTKGSFKFTHDTWQQITRERELFPEELRMVGWYHTHPDWGVFLSTMDMFICDNFFNKSLDVALVLDPCRQDRGFFQWTGSAAQRLRRTGGFYLIASRFRQYELEDYAAYLESKFAMTSDPRFRGLPPSPAPVVNIAGQQSPWQSVALVGTLALQFCFLMLIAWRVLVPADSGQPDRIAAIQDSVDRLAEARLREAELDAKIQALDTVLGQPDNAPDGLLRELSERTGEVEELRSSVRGHQALETALDARIAALESKLAQSEQQEESLRAAVRGLEQRRDQQRDEIAQLEARLAAYETSEKEENAEADSATSPATNWTWIGIGGVALVVVAVAVAMVVMITKKKEGPDSEESSEETSDETNNN